MNPIYSSFLGKVIRVYFSILKSEVSQETNVFKEIKFQMSEALSMTFSELKILPVS